MRELCARVAAMCRRGRVSVWEALQQHRGVAVGLGCGALLLLALPAMVLAHVYFDRDNLPDLDPFVRFEFPAIGHVYDSSGRPLIELAREHRLISRYEDIPQVVRDAILAVEDKRFYSHNGVDYGSVPRVLARIRLTTLVARLFRNPFDEAASPAIFPQGGSTITQQLVRGHFLKGLTSGENSRGLQGIGRLTSSIAYVLGARNANMIARKIEEIRLSLWIEQEMARRFGSKRRAKEELLARYASYIYMGSGQYGFAVAARHYFARPLASLTAADADLAAVLAGIPKSPRDYAPSARNRAGVLRRRNQTLALMARTGVMTQAGLVAAVARPLPAVAPGAPPAGEAPAVVAHVLEELKGLGVARGLDDLLQGRIQVHSTVDLRVQRVVNEALERGLRAYERRHPRAAGIVQGSVIVLANADARVLAEAGGRRVVGDRPASYSDFNRVVGSLRQPGSAIKPILYLAAFRDGAFDLDTLVPDEPIAVPDGAGVKWIANYDGRFKGRMPLRQALAESRNAVAVWITTEIGIDRMIRTSQRLGIRTPLHRYVTTALGASEVTLLELANAYRIMASGLVAQPYIIETIAGVAAGTGSMRPARQPPSSIGDEALLLIQEGLRGVVRLPGGTAHALNARNFPIAVMGKTGTTNGFRDALFVGSTYGAEGITIAVRIGFDDNRSLGASETGGRVALPIFRDIMLGFYGDTLAAPKFPAAMEARITAYLAGPPVPIEAPVLESARQRTLQWTVSSSEESLRVLQRGLLIP